jgi:uncharacterized membrane protein YfcA
MPLTTIAALTATMVATAFLSGIFGMAGGMILMGVLLALLSVPEAMALHGLTQMVANGWRGLLWHSYPGSCIRHEELVGDRGVVC